MASEQNRSLDTIHPDRLNIKTAELKTEKKSNVVTFVKEKLEQQETSGSGSLAEDYDKMEEEMLTAERKENRSQDEEDDDDLDETLGEMLLGLTEMFPQFVHTGTVAFVKNTCILTQALLRLAKAATRIAFSTVTTI